MRVMRMNKMNIQAALGRSVEAEQGREVHGVSVSELRALQNVDLVAGPELLDEALSPRFSERNVTDLDRLGPMKQKPSDQKAVLRSLGRFVRTTEGQTQAAAKNAEDVVKEARLRAVVEQIYNMRTMIRDSKTKRS